MEIVLITLLAIAVATLALYQRSSNGYNDARFNLLQHDIETIAATRKSYFHEIED